MLTNKQLDEIREHLQAAQNPVFLYDNDADGLCSFLLLQRWLGRGKGIAIRSYPDLDESYVRRIKEANADYVFVLDKPVLAGEFVKGVQELGLPFVWIDHHTMPLPEFFSWIHIYNPALNKGKQKSSEPVTYLCYKVTERKEDLWIAMIGCIADHYLPEFAKEFAKEYPDYWGVVKKPFDAYFGTEIGKIAMAFNFGVKDRASGIEETQKYLLSCRSPGDVLAEKEENNNLRKHFEEFRHKYDSLLFEAQNSTNGNEIFFEYGGNISISSELSNALGYYSPGKYVCVAFRKGGVVNISLRGKNVKKIIEDILPQIPNSNGGGHEDAVGARIPMSELDKFKTLFLEAVKKKVK
jgi:single-stranded DNA-specific DHH superfamily exonuclease